MVSAHQNLNGSRGLTTPLSGRFAIRELALATINLSTKFEDFISTHYEVVKADTKCRKWGVLGTGLVRNHSRSLEIAPFDRAHTSSC